MVISRRRFLNGVVMALAPLGAAADAQEHKTGKVYRIGAVWTNADPRGEDVLRQGLRELGWVEGQNFILERRYSEGRNERHPGHVAELLRLQPDLIITVGTPATLAVQEATGQPSPLSSYSWPTPSGQAWSEAWLDPAEISQGSLVVVRNSLASMSSF